MVSQNISEPTRKCLLFINPIQGEVGEQKGLP